MHKQPKIVAIAGGQSLRRTWLARRLWALLGSRASHLSLDDFQVDGAALPPRLRARFSCENPRAIDWPLLEQILTECRAGKSARVPRFNLVTHMRESHSMQFSRGSVVLVNGLWLLLRPKVRSLFDFTVFLATPAIAGGRNGRHFSMEEDTSRHDPACEQQACFADIVLQSAPESAEVEDLAETIRALLAESENSDLISAEASWPMLEDFSRSAAKSVRARGNLGSVLTGSKPIHAYARS